MFDPNHPKIVELVDRNNTASAATLLLAEHIDKTLIIDTIEPLYFRGVSGSFVGSVFNAKIAYLALEIVPGVAPPESVSPAYFSFHDFVDVIRLSVPSSDSYWDALGAVPKYVAKSLTLQNMFFYRYSDTGFVQLSFIGYKITLK